MITDMERIGDNARDIAEICMILPKDYEKNFPIIKDMALATIDIVNNSINSFVNNDLDLAKKIEREDDIVDDFFVTIRDQLIGEIKEGFDPAAAIDFIMISKYLERIADHSVNIANWVIFSIEGWLNDYLSCRRRYFNTKGNWIFPKEQGLGSILLWKWRGFF